LAKKILENKNKFVNNEEKLRIFVIGGKEDANVVKTDEDGQVIDLCGKISFKESGILLKYAKVAVANDSGPFHIARAVKAKTFVFFGPTDPKLFSFEKNTFLLNNPSCPPHSLYGDDKFPKKYADCMTGISVETVFNKIVKEYN
jgi:lipopolysaccharide core biosynthesis protein rfaQ